MAGGSGCFEAPPLSLWKRYRFAFSHSHVVTDAPSPQYPHLPMSHAHAQARRVHSHFPAPPCTLLYLLSQQLHVGTNCSSCTPSSTRLGRPARELPRAYFAMTTEDLCVGGGGGRAEVSAGSVAALSRVEPTCGRACVRLLCTPPSPTATPHPHPFWTRARPTPSLLFRTSWETGSGEMRPMGEGISTAVLPAGRPTRSRRQGCAVFERRKPRLVRDKQRISLARYSVHSARTAVQTLESSLSDRARINYQDNHYSPIHGWHSTNRRNTQCSKRHLTFFQKRTGEVSICTGDAPERRKRTWRGVRAYRRARPRERAIKDKGHKQQPQRERHARQALARRHIS